MNRSGKVTITTATGRYIDYTYDASGTLIKKQQYDNSTLQKTTDYVDGFLAENSTLVYFAMPEGKVMNTGGTLKTQYLIADQQGNVRVSVEDNGNNIAVVKQENSYYPFGLIMPNSQIALPSQPNKNLYNSGSEWQNDYGDLPDLYQTFYRSYDAALGRFTGIDPAAISAESLSPYHYAGNNPVMYNDPLGNATGDWDTLLKNYVELPQTKSRDTDGPGNEWFREWENKTIAANEGLLNPADLIYDAARGGYSYGYQVPNVTHSTDENGKTVDEFGVKWIRGFISNVDNLLFSNTLEEVANTGRFNYNSPYLGYLSHDTYIGSIKKKEGRGIITHTTVFDKNMRLKSTSLGIDVKLFGLDVDSRGDGGSLSITVMGVGMYFGLQEGGLVFGSSYTDEHGAIKGDDFYYKIPDSWKKAYNDFNNAFHSNNSTANPFGGGPPIYSPVY